MLGFQSNHVELEGFAFHLEFIREWAFLRLGLSTVGHQVVLLNPGFACDGLVLSILP